MWNVSTSRTHRRLNFLLSRYSTWNPTFNLLLDRKLGEIQDSSVVSPVVIRHKTVEIFSDYNIDDSYVRIIMVYVLKITEVHTKNV